MEGKECTPIDNSFITSGGSFSGPFGLKMDFILPDDKEDITLMKKHYRKNWNTGEIIILHNTKLLRDKYRNLSLCKQIHSDQKSSFQSNASDLVIDSKWYFLNSAIRSNSRNNAYNPSSDSDGKDREIMTSIVNSELKINPLMQKHQLYQTWKSKMRNPMKIALFFISSLMFFISSLIHMRSHEQRSKNNFLYFGLELLVPLLLMHSEVESTACYCNACANYLPVLLF
ncbi:MAG: hypothetical protein FD143_3092 [Ignavibacteria bacterium]|nr:MAG: hypothetical protein FD143_3092 [Ignavibacteria bacterium]